MQDYRNNPRRPCTIRVRRIENACGDSTGHPHMPHASCVVVECDCRGSFVASVVKHCAAQGARISVLGAQST